MPNKLFIRVLSLKDDTENVLADFEWALYARAGEKLASGIAPNFETVKQVLEQNSIEDIQIIGLVPANFVNTTQVKIPGKQTRFVQQAVPFAVEEQLAEDLDSVHIALGSLQGDGYYLVDIVNQDLFEIFHDALVDTGYVVAGVYSDASLLPLVDSDITLGVENNWVLVKTKAGSISRVGYYNLAHYFESLTLVTDDDDNTEEVLPTEPLSVSCYVPEELLESLNIQFTELELAGNYQWSNQDLKIPIIELLCESWYQQGSKGTNLCQGEYKLVSTGDSSFRQWRGVAAVAALWFLLQVGLNVGKGYYYQQESTQYRQEALQIYKNIFPAETRVNTNNLRRALQGKLAQGASNSGVNDFLTLLSETGYQHSKIPNSQSISFNSISFSDQRKELSIDLKASSFEQLDQLKNGLTAAGLGAKISSAVNEENSVRGRLSVTGS